MPAKSHLITILRPLAIAVALALVVRAAFVRMYAIPSPSMAPTLRSGDQIIVTPYRFPFADQPEQGDVIVFRSPLRADELMVKRIIATPGDLIETHAGRVFVRGHALAEPYVARQAASGTIAPQIIPAGCYFVAGDNRENSLDSRSWGVLPRTAIAGRARMILWSWGDGGGSPRADAAPRANGALKPQPLRCDRLFKVIR